MDVDRRDFLRNAGLVAGALPLTGACASSVAPGPSGGAFTFQDWESLRSEFRQDFRWRNFAGFLLASRPRIVEEDIALHRRELNRNAPVYLREVYRIEAEVREKAARYLGVDAKQISLTGNTTMGLATLYNQLRIRPDQEVVTTEHEHYSCKTSLRYRAEREGIGLRTIRLYDDPARANEDEILDRLRRNITPKTRALALTWVHSGSSIKLPAAEVSSLVKDLNRGRAEEDRLLFCLDGVHGFGVENTSFDELGCDFFVAGTHKWIFGPSGTGIMCSRDSELANVSPTIPPFNFGGSSDFGSEMTPGGFHPFENRCAVRKAFEFHLAIGKQAVQERIHGLNDYAKERLDALPRVELVTPKGSGLSAGFTFFRVKDRKAEEVQERMLERQIVVSAADRDAGPVVRIAPGLLNDTDEVDALIEALREGV